MHTHLMQFSWTEDVQPSADLGYAANDADGYVLVEPVRSPVAAVPGATLQDEYDFGGYAGI